MRNNAAKERSSLPQKPIPLSLCVCCARRRENSAARDPVVTMMVPCLWSQALCFLNKLEFTGSGSLFGGACALGDGIS